MQFSTFFTKNILMNIYAKEVINMKNINIFHNLCVCRSIHLYAKINPWTCALDFSKELIKSVIYQDNNLLVLNKPYGVSFSKDGDNKLINHVSNTDCEDVVFKKEVKHRTVSVKSAYHPSGVVKDNLNLLDCLPYLKNHFGLQDLHIARVPGKYVSGVAILTTSKEYIDYIKKCRLHAPTGKDKYLAVVVGTPRFQESEIKLGFKLEEKAKFGKRPILLQKWSNKAYKEGKIRIGTFHYRTLSHGTDRLTSLVEIRVDLRKYHAYRLFCANYLLSPVLGDNLYGGRVQTVMGVPVEVDPFSDVANTPQVLPKNIYKMLNLTSRDSSLIPVHIHLAEMLLPRFFENKSPLILKAPLPPYFEWTCEKLGLITSTQDGLVLSNSVY